MLITSTANEQIKHLKKLQTKKYRDQAKQLVVENWKTIVDAAKAGVYPKVLYVESSQQDKLPASWQKLFKARELILVNQKVNHYFSSLSTPSGVAALYDWPAEHLNLKQSVIYCNNINDPGNLGTLLRSALAFGLTNVVIDEYCADLYNPKTVAAAKEALFKLNISFDSKLKVLTDIKAKMPVVVTSLATRQPIQVLKDKKQFCLVLGNEAHGVSPELAKQADLTVKIPMSQAMESLNVAIAGSIIFYELYKK